MLNFDEELKKFKPSVETTEVEDEVYKNEIEDLMDVYQRVSDNASGSVRSEKGHQVKS